jgi:hypothetical protein
VGYNRVYVHTGDDLTYGGWWEGLASKRSFVTNGPLIDVRVGGELPGATFGIEHSGMTLPIEVAAWSKDPVGDLEVLVNGEVALQVPLAADGRARTVGEITLDEPGWILIRAIADVDHTFRFASTAPWRVTGPDGEDRISRRAAQFFIDWIDERQAMLALDDGGQSRDVSRRLLQARNYWVGRRSLATCP